ncbi:MAG: phosphate ABC transporter permease subunit PstC [Janthinobacterium lividum]
MSESSSTPMPVTRVKPVVPGDPETSASSTPEAVPDRQVASEVRRYLIERGSGSFADSSFAGMMVVCAISVILIVLLIVYVLVSNSRLSIHTFGFKFFETSVWDPVNGSFGALPFIYGTVVSSLLAVVIAVPLAIAVSIFVLEICPIRLRGPIAFLTELLAAIPSVVYGLWAVFVLVPIVRDQLGPVLEKSLGWTGLFTEPNFGVGILTASFILAIMIFPVICSISRDVMRAVPSSQREAALALGATRWEMIRIGVLRNARMGIVGAVILGLGRALGETMAVTMVIGNHPDISKNLFNPAYTLASVIANEFSEATGDLYLSALIEIGLALFLVTIVVNAIARLLVWAVTRGNSERAAA